MRTGLREVREIRTGGGEDWTISVEGRWREVKTEGGVCILVVVVTAQCCPTITVSQTIAGLSAIV